MAASKQIPPDASSVEQRADPPAAEDDITLLISSLLAMSVPQMHARTLPAHLTTSPPDVCHQLHRTSPPGILLSNHFEKDLSESMIHPNTNLAASTKASASPFLRDTKQDETPFELANTWAAFESTTPSAALQTTTRSWPTLWEDSNARGFPTTSELLLINDLEYIKKQLDNVEHTELSDSLASSDAFQTLSDPLFHTSPPILMDLLEASLLLGTAGEEAPPLTPPLSGEQNLPGTSCQEIQIGKETCYQLPEHQALSTPPPPSPWSSRHGRPNMEEKDLPRLNLKLNRPGRSGEGPTFWGMWEDERARMVYVSWLPRAARARDRTQKKKCELELKEFITKTLGFSGLQKVLLFPPSSAHCKLLFATEQVAIQFLSTFGGLDGEPGPALWKSFVCEHFAVNIRGGIHATRVRIIWADQTKNDLIAADFSAHNHLAALSPPPVLD